MLALIVGLALLTWAASGVVESTVREWFGRDAQSRSQFAAGNQDYLGSTIQEIPIQCQRIC